MTQIDMIKRIAYHISIGYSIFDNSKCDWEKIIAFGLKTEFLKFKRLEAARFMYSLFLFFINFLD